jgi:hypothetical protein
MLLMMSRDENRVCTFNTLQVILDKPCLARTAITRYQQTAKRWICVRMHLPDERIKLRDDFHFCNHVVPHLVIPSIDIPLHIFLFSQPKNALRKPG